ncbi:MAG: hypothetical protein II604_00395 [Bacteroidales bacterium]|nr:hypothetical protein [Bacteroidales bacterium]
MDFGQYQGRTVQQCIDLGNTRYLRWIYYNCSKISFMPDILDEIGVTEEWRIEKAGKDPEKGKMLDDEKDKNHNNHLKRLSETDKMEAIKQSSKYSARLRKQSNRKLMQFERQDTKYFSKGAMQRRNHGH